MPLAPIQSTLPRVFQIPTSSPESDGTIEWRKTTIVIVQIEAGGQQGIGYSYCDAGAASMIDRVLRPTIEGLSAFDTPLLWQKMMRSIRNIGRGGVALDAISAVDHALWDLKAKLLGVPLASLLGQSRPSVLAYMSGGFTSYTDLELAHAAESWADAGFLAAKIKVGRDPERDPERVRLTRKALGLGVDLMVDANGAYEAKQAMVLARRFEESAVIWFEEPVSSDHLSNLARIRNALPATMELAAGEYGFDPFYFKHMLEAQAVDVLQIDATRCGGVTGFLKAAALAETYSIPVSSHCAPSLHVHLCCSIPNLRHLEYFHDHARIENLLFDGVPQPIHGRLSPDLSRPGTGLILKTRGAELHAA